MIIDSTLVFDQGTYSASTGMTGIAQFGNATTNPSTNVLDMQQGRDMGGGIDFGAEISAVVLITTAFSGGTSLNVQLQGSTDNTTYTTYSETGAIAVAALTQGTKLVLPFPPVNPDAGKIPRYYRLAYVNAGANTAGSVLAYAGVNTVNRYYPPGVVVNN